MQQRNLFSINGERSFLPALAGHLLDSVDEQPHRLSRILVLLPTRRACRTLADCFHKQSSKQASLLPGIRPLGELEQGDHLPFPIYNLSMNENTSSSSSPEKLWTNIPPAMPALQRQFYFARLLMQKESSLSDERAFMLAELLSQWMDEIQSEELSFDRLDQLVPESLASHWQDTLKFLDIIKHFWPQILAEHGMIDRATRRTLIIDKQIEAWQHSPPDYPIVIAGSTGTVPAIRRLLDFVSKLPQGKVILPALAIPPALFSHISEDPTHPQYGLAQLLNSMETTPDSVQTLPQSDYEPSQPIINRTQFLIHAMLPAKAAESDLIDLPQTHDQQALDGIKIIKAVTIQQEAETIACLFRQFAEEPEKTVALITPDRDLARRVISALARWDISIDDSAGIPALNTPLGSYLSLVIEVVRNQLRPIALLSLLKHPFCALGFQRKTFLDLVRYLERELLPADIPPTGIEELKVCTHKGSNKVMNAECLRLIERLEQALLPLLHNHDQQSLKTYLTAHLTVAESLAQTEEEIGAHRLWKREVGRVFSNHFEALLNLQNPIPMVRANDYAGVFRTLFRSLVVRNNYGLHPNFSILSPLEARLHQFDHIILGGLNEGRWPAQIRHDPFLSRPMRSDFGLPDDQRRIGLSAHDFITALHGQSVTVTFSKEIDHAPAVPSRWWERLLVMAEKAVLSIEEDKHTLFYTQEIDKAPEFMPIKRPEPCPPLAARPRSLSVTAIRTLLNNPYQLYTEKILRLREKEGLEQPPDAAMRGQLIHGILEDYYKERMAQPHLPFNLPRLLELAEIQLNPLKAQHPEIYYFIRERFTHIADHLRKIEESRNQNPQVIYTEIKGELDLELKNNLFKLTAKADRIDLLPDGSLEIIDYKTGTIPAVKHIKGGNDPQLLLEALISERGGFKTIKDGEALPVSSINIYDLAGRREPSHRLIALDETIPTEVEQKLRNLITYYEDEQTNYAAKPNLKTSYLNGFDHFQRFDEWKLTHAL